VHPVSIAGAILGAIVAIVGLAWVLWSSFQLLRTGIVVTDSLLRLVAGRLPRSHWRCGVILASVSFGSGLLYSSGLAWVFGWVFVGLLVAFFLMVFAVSVVASLVLCISGSIEYKRSQAEMVIT
jgi:hypothetical protein